MPPEVAILNNIKYEPLMLIVIIYIVFRKPIEQFFNFLWCKVTKKKSITWEQYVEIEAMERLKRQKEVDDRLDRIQADVNRLGTKVLEIRKEIDTFSEALENFEDKVDLMDKVNLTNTLFTESNSPYRRLKAYLYLIAMGANGRVRKKGMELILEHQETYFDVQDVISEKLNFGSPEDKTYYDDTLMEINRRIRDTHGKPYAEPLEKLESIN